jgi:hypothetical protein
MFLSVAIRAEVAGEKLMIGSFSSGSLDHWEAKEFKGQTNYQLVDLAGTRVLKAESANSASGLFKEQRIDLQKTPVMSGAGTSKTGSATTSMNRINPAMTMLQGFMW